MDEKRKAWCEKYKVKIADGGFIDKFCMPEHVECILPTQPGQKPYFIGFDGKSKTYEQLTEEEKQDYLEQQAQIQENLHEFTNRKRALEKSNINIVKNNRDKVHKNALEKSNINLIKDIGKEPGE